MQPMYRMNTFTYVATLFVITQISSVTTRPFFFFQDGFNPFQQQGEFGDPIPTEKIVMHYNEIPTTKENFLARFPPLLTGAPAKEWFFNEYTNLLQNPKLSLQLSGIFE